MPESSSPSALQNEKISLSSVLQQLDGCHNVFLDLGANIGIHARFLFEPHKYPSVDPNGAKPHPYASVFDEIFGTERNLSVTCAFEFEPNPRHTDRHLMMQQAYARQGWRYVYAPFGVSNAPGELSFFRNAQVGGARKRPWWGDRNEEWSFSTMQLDPKERPVIVPSIDIGALLLRVGARVLPPDQQTPPRVLAKMDLEGYEVQVLPHLLAAPSRLLCQFIDGLTLEFHSHLKGQYAMHKAMEVEQEGKLRREVNESDCRFKYFRLLDDESYVHDGKPLPEIVSTPEALAASSSPTSVTDFGGSSSTTTATSTSTSTTYSTSSDGSSSGESPFSLQVLTREVHLRVPYQRELWKSYVVGLGAVKPKRTQLIIDSPPTAVAITASKTSAACGPLLPQPTQIEDIFDDVTRLDLGVVGHAVPSGMAVADGYAEAARTMTHAIASLTWRRKGVAVLRSIVACPTPYCIFMDDDLFSFSQPNYSWPLAAIAYLEQHPEVLTVSPWVMPGQTAQSCQCFSHVGCPCFTSRSKDMHGSNVSSTSFSDRVFLYSASRMTRYIIGLGQLKPNSSLAFEHVWPTVEARRKRAGKTPSWFAFMEDQRAWFVHPPYRGSFQLALYGKQCHNKLLLIQGISAGKFPAANRCHVVYDRCGNMAGRPWLNQMMYGNMEGLTISE